MTYLYMYMCIVFQSKLKVFLSYNFSNLTIRLFAHGSGMLYLGSTDLEYKTTEPELYTNVCCGSFDLTER
jgi:hypothetical protein